MVVRQTGPLTDALAGGQRGKYVGMLVDAETGRLLGMWAAKSAGYRIGPGMWVGEGRDQIGIPTFRRAEGGLARWGWVKGICRL